MNIVSIDFDIIMAPSIELYNNLQHNYASYYEEMFNADLTIYNKITNWLLNILPQINTDDVVFIESHEQIVDFIPSGMPCDLINIDHHHDLGYGENAKEEPLNCGNWGLYLLKDNKINNYIWIKNNNSIRPQYCGYNYKTKEFYNFNLSSLPADKIIICLSSPWVPQKYRPLFNLWMDMAGKLKDTNYFLQEK